MRRTDREITDFNKMTEIAGRCDCCRIGLTDDKGAYIVPLNFGMEVRDGRLRLFFHSAQEGKKIDLMKKQSRVSFEMDCRHELMKGTSGCQYTYLYESVMGRGTITFLDGIEEKYHAFRQIFTHYIGHSDIPMNEEAVSAAAVYRLDVTEWSCKEHK